MKNNTICCDSDPPKPSSEEHTEQQLGQRLTSRCATYLCGCSCVLTTLTDQEGHSEVRDLGCHSIQPHTIAAAVLKMSRHGTTQRTLTSAGPAVLTELRQRYIKHSFTLPSSFPSVPLAHQFLKPPENHLPSTLPGPCAFSCVKREAKQAAATPQLPALPGGLSFPRKQPQDPGSAG